MPAESLPEQNAADSSGPEARIAELEAELAQSRDQTLRALAEAENTRKRALKEREDSSKYAIMSFARNLLDVADNFTRALEAVPEELKNTEPQITALLTGIEATGRELEKAFEKHGIHKIEPKEDEVFNHNFHEVMFEVPGTGKPPGTIMQVIETGYVIHDRLLRPARVGVAKDDGSFRGSQPSGAGHTLDTEA
ncbi:MAG: nucleotide exchange factor GrpE [Rhodospirillales bacterium]|nr:nucleotide exchange factor GrpE [Rhodospirillales bacterium]